jgi:hypothetical protein
MHTKFLSESLKRRNHYGGVGIDGGMVRIDASEKEAVKKDKLD